MIEKGLIGYEDINFGTDTFQRMSQSGQFIPVTKVRGLHIPIVDSADRFSSNDVESALAECMTREENGTSVKRLTNRSGNTRVLGDVVIVDTNYDDSFTTTTTEGSSIVFGVVLSSIGNNIVGTIATGGYVAELKVDSSTVRGQFLKTSTVATKATPVNTNQQGVFAIALSNSSSVVSAFIFGGYKAASGTVVTNLNADMIDGLHTNVVEIGDWNMDSVSSVLITHGLDYTKIRSFSSFVRNDSGLLYPLNIHTGATTAADGIIYQANSTQFYLGRNTGGYFDSANFNSTSYNRGWITILSTN